MSTIAEVVAAFVLGLRSSKRIVLLGADMNSECFVLLA